MSHRFIPGTRVQWDSQANGSLTVKTGEVLGLIPANTIITKVVPGMAKVPRNRILGQFTSTVDRYLVAVNKGKRKESFYYYTPRAKQVKELQ